jgi:phosphoglycerate kinase
MLKKKSILDIKIENKKVVIRVDFNVSINNGEILDDTRIKETIPTLKYLVERNNSLIILTHYGRPKGYDLNFSLKPIVKRLSRYLKQDICLIDHIKENPLSVVKNIKPKQVVVLENVRFNKGDELNDDQYAKVLASLGEIYVNDAFAVSHRAHASTVGIAKFLPAYAGLLLIKEINIIDKVLHNPDRPVVSVIAGAKITDKIGLIKKQLDHAQTVLVGGGIANTFLKAKGHHVGRSLAEDTALETARQLLYEAASKHSALILPIDVVVQNVKNKKIRNAAITEITSDEAIMDVGKNSTNTYVWHLLNCGTIIFNGPVGKYEEKPFDKASLALIRATAESKALSVVGGGDTLALIPNKKVASGITHISTGGGAMLEFIEKGNLPAIEVLN